MLVCSSFGFLPNRSIPTTSIPTTATGKSLHIDANPCTGCLQCGMACSYENHGVFNIAKSRIRVFDCGHAGRKTPYTCTQRAGAGCLNACPVDAIPLQLDLPEGTTVQQVIGRFGLPQKSCHLVLVDECFVPPPQRSHHRLEDGNTLALWPPIAGG